MLTSNFSYKPTEHWGLRWSTGYSFTTSQFTDHVLSLTRTLHDWDASFDFIKAQNGNFSFMFRVHLRANPDIKVDYSQRPAGVPPRTGDVPLEPITRPVTCPSRHSPSPQERLSRPAGRSIMAGHGDSC
jgi:hypothetical protein